MNTIQVADEDHDFENPDYKTESNLKSLKVWMKCEAQRLMAATLSVRLKLRTVDQTDGRR